MGNNAQPTTGIRQRAVFGSMDTAANTNTVAIGLNAPRAECVWGNATDWQPLELAANAAALYMLLEAGAPFGVARKNFSNFPTSATDQTSWQVTPGRGGVGGAPTTAQLVSALNNGVTPISINTQGQAYLVKRITTRSLNGTTADYRIRDAHKVSVCDYWCDDTQSVLQQQFGGKDLLPDLQVGNPAFPPQATSPRIVGGAIKSMVQNYGNAGQWSYPPGLTALPGQTPADVIIANMIVQQEINPPTRVSALAPLSPVNILDQIALLAQQVG